MSPISIDGGGSSHNRRRVYISRLVETLIGEFCLRQNLNNGVIISNAGKSWILNRVQDFFYRNFTVRQEISEKERTTIISAKAGDIGELYYYSQQ